MKSPSQQWESKKRLQRTGFFMVLILPSLSVLSEAGPFKKHTPGARVHAHAVEHACTHNYGDRISQQAIQKFIKNMTCIVLLKLFYTQLFHLYRLSFPLKSSESSLKKIIALLRYFISSKLELN